MEEAGFRNCISVPDGAPPSVSSKELPPLEQVFFMLNMLCYIYIYILTYTLLEYTVICYAIIQC
jgi:hypothetical protein